MLVLYMYTGIYRGIICIYQYVYYYVISDNRSYFFLCSCPFPSPSPPPPKNKKKKITQYSEQLCNEDLWSEQRQERVTSKLWKHLEEQLELAKTCPPSKVLFFLNFLFPNFFSFYFFLCFVSKNS